MATSCLFELFPTFEDVQTSKLRVSSGETVYTWDMIQQKLMDKPQLQSTPLNLGVEVFDVDSQVVKQVYDSCKTIPSSETNVCFTAYRIKKYDNVRFFNAEMIQNKKGKSVFYPPRMVINVSDIPINESFVIDTGYIFLLPQVSAVPIIEDSKIIYGKPVTQPNFIIMAEITGICGKDKNKTEVKTFIPAMSIRDQEDTGLLKIGGLLKQGSLTQLQITFKAYSTMFLPTHIFIENGEQDDGMVFKTKDSSTGRAIKNPKVKFYADSMTVAENKATFTTFDSKTSPVEAYKNQKLCIRDCIALIVSRKREWTQPDVFTTSGIFNGNNSIIPKVFASNINTNTHCLVFIQHKLCLFSRSTEQPQLCKIINGFYFNDDHYKLKSKIMSEIIPNLKLLTIGANHVKKASNQFDKKILMIMYDYLSHINEHDAEFMELYEKVKNGERIGISNPISCKLEKSLKTMIDLLYGNDNEPPTKKLRR